MPQISRSAKLFMERRAPEAQETLRTPGPRSNLDRNLAHQIPLSAPLPTTDVLQEQGGMPPDAGKTLPWPHGREEQV